MLENAVIFSAFTPPFGQLVQLSPSAAVGLDRKYSVMGDAVGLQQKSFADVLSLHQ